MRVTELITVLYVRDQRASRDFYAALLGAEPTLDVPGMTEFAIAPGITLGLMPESGIATLITPPMPHPSTANGTPRCELYLRVDNATEAYEIALTHGATPVSEPAPRDWGEHVGYISDPDGHIIAFAQPTP